MRTRVRSMYRPIVVVPLVLLIGCGVGSRTASPPSQVLLPVGAPPVPVPGDPWFGSEGNVLISDRQFNRPEGISYLWIGFNSREEWQKFLLLNQNFPNQGFIGGHVVVEPRNAAGFYFDPDTTLSAEAILDIFGTALVFIKQDPAFYAQFPDRFFVIPSTEQICQP